MREASTETIDNVKYQACHWQVDKANSILARLLKLLGEPMSEVVMGLLADAKGGDQPVSEVLNQDMSEAGGKIAAKLGLALKGLSVRLDEDIVKNTMRDICGADLLADGKQVIYDTHYMGRIGHMYRVALFVLKHQYADFLGANPAQSA